MKLVKVNGLIRGVWVVALFCCAVGLVNARVRESANVLSNYAILLQQQTSPEAGGLQRGAVPSQSDAKDRECQRRRAEWDRNLASRSAFWGFVLNVLVLFLLTILKFSGTWIRLFWSVVAAAVLAPVSVGLQKFEQLKVCPEPPGFFSVLSADLFIWTLSGIALAVALMAGFRYFNVVRSRFQRRTAP